MANKGKSEHMIPIVVLAESMKSYPVTAIQIILLLLRIFKRASICFKRQAIIHKQTAAPKFLVFFLSESTNILANVIREIKRAANVIDPNADL